jgi:hypothetical protein
MSLVLACLFSLLQAPPRDRAATAAPAGGVVSGRVYAEATGTPMQGALVVLSPASAPMDGWPAWSFGGSGYRADMAGYSAQTDAAGAFVIPEIKPGEYRLVARTGYFGGRYLGAGYQAVRAGDLGRPIVVKNGDRLAGIDIALPTAAAIEGRVIDESGEPLSMMTVVAARIMPGSDVPQPVRHRPTLTDDLGRYRVYGLEPGEYVVATDGLHVVAGTATRSAPVGFATTFHPSAASVSAAQRIRLTAGRDASAIDILVARSSLVEVSGMVLDSRGAPASTANGLLTRTTLAGEGTHPFHTDANGRFRVHGLDAGDYRLLIGRGGAVNGRVEYADLPLSLLGNTEGLVVATQPGITVSGRVILAEGQPLEMRALRITFERHGVAVRTLETFATIDEDRRFRGQDVFGPHLVRVSGLPAGSTVKAVMLRGQDITDVPTVFRAEDSDQLQVVITSRASTLDGVVRDEGTAPPVEAIVYVFGEDRGAWRLSSPRTHKSDAGADGKFSVSGLAAGRYYAIAIARDGFRQVPNAGEAFFDLLSKEATPFVIGDDERRTLELRPWRWPE